MSNKQQNIVLNWFRRLEDITQLKRPRNKMLSKFYSLRQCFRSHPEVRFWNKTQLPHRRRFGDHLKVLEKDANSNLNNPESQYQLLRELNKSDPKAVVSRVESGKIAVNDLVAQEYFIAVAKTGRIARSSSRKILQYFSSARASTTQH